MGAPLPIRRGAGRRPVRSLDGPRLADALDEEAVLSLFCLKDPMMEQCARMIGAEVVLHALADRGVEVVVSYPGSAILPIHDALARQNRVRRVLVCTSRRQHMPLMGPRARPAASASCA